MPSDCIYDHPEYYDILFGWDRTKEVGFYDRIFRRCGVRAGAPVLELACGTGRVALLLAKRGWRLTGLDVRREMVEFLRARAAAEQIELESLCLDMAAFSTEQRFAAAYNPLSSFRLLADDRSAAAHLRSVAAALSPGGVYVLDLELAADAAHDPVTTDESWEMTRGPVTVRAQNDGVYVNDRGVERVLVWGPETHLRPYTTAAFQTLVAGVGELALESWHPEQTRAAGVSEFDAARSAEAPRSGRAMVVLRRRR